MKRLAMVLSAFVLAFTLAPAVMAAVDIPEPQPMTVCVYENANGWNNGDELCTTAEPLALHRYDLSLVTVNLHNGCQSVIFRNSSWNDCISSIYIPSMASGWHLETYDFSNYQVLRRCISSAGYYNLTLNQNDTASSFRMVSGSC